MDTSEGLPDEETLRAWDWRADLKAQQRSVPWLAQRTDRSQQVVYRYGWGTSTAPLAWLRQAAQVLGWKGTETP